MAIDFVQKNLTYIIENFKLFWFFNSRFRYYPILNLQIKISKLQNEIIILNKVSIGY